MAYEVSPNVWIGSPLEHARLEHGVPGLLVADTFPTVAAAAQLRVSIDVGLSLPVRPPPSAFLRRGRWAVALAETVTLTAKVEYDIGGGTWIDLSQDVISSVKAAWGIHGNGPHDRIAEPGTLSFDMDNSAANSAGIRGYYSPDHDDVRAGFVMGAPVRLVIGGVVKWVGRISRVAPKAGVRDPTSAVECTDWLEEAARAKLSGLPVQVDVQSDRLFSVLVAAVETPPPGGTRIATGSDVYPFALDNAQDESGRVLGEFQKLALSEFGQVYVDAGVAVFEGRRRRGAETDVLFEFHEDVQILALPVTASDRDGVINRIQVSAHPRRRDVDDDTVLFSLASAVEILRNTTTTINCPYRDPEQRSQRVGGIDMQAPVCSFNVSKEGDGNDLTSQLDVVAVFGGNSALITITNNGPADGWIPPAGLELLGRGLYDFEPVVSDEVDADSIEAYGESVSAYDMPHQDSPNIAQDLARYLLHLYADPITRAVSVQFLGNWDSETAQALLNLNISDRVRITAPTVGLDGEVYHANGWRLDVHQSGLAMATLDLVRADPTLYWLLGVEGRSELGETTILGYQFMAAGWVLEQEFSSLGANTFLN